MIVQRFGESNSSLKKPAVVRAPDHIRESLDKQRRDQVARRLGPRRWQSQTENSDTAKLTRTTTEVLPSTHPITLDTVRANLTQHSGHINDRTSRTKGREFYSAQKMNLRRYPDRLSTIPIEVFQ